MNKSYGIKLLLALAIFGSPSLTFSKEFPLEETVEGVTHAASRERVSLIAKARKAGDLGPLVQAFNDRDLPVLWYVVTAAKPHKPTPEESVEYNAFLEKAKQLLSQIPQHTQRHIDILEVKAQIGEELAIRPDGTPNWYPPKEHDFKTMEEVKEWDLKAMRSFVGTGREFNQLVDLGSAECVQTLMTYVWDDRRVGFVSDMNGHYTRAESNGLKALHSLRRILGDSRPDKSFIGERDPYFGENLEAVRAAYRDWWQSEKSLPWRKTIFPTSRAPILAKLTLEETKQVEEASGELWLYVLCGFLILMVVWFSAKRSAP